MNSEFPVEDWIQKRFYLSQARKNNRQLVFWSAIIYGIAFFCMAWFVWYPAFAEYHRDFDKIIHSPVLFFMIVWIVGTFFPTWYSISRMKKTEINARNVLEETKILSKEVHLIENSSSYEK
jgi:hypothetical protein